MTVFWLEQTLADVPDHDDWLSAAERAVLSGLRIPKRRADWRLGRWTAKRAIAAVLGRDPARLDRIVIGVASSGAPEADGISLSISHSGGAGLAAVGPEGMELGCDLETIEERPAAFLADFFTREEQAFVAAAADPVLAATLVWSAKESALKALREGLRLDTRTVQSGILPDGRFTVRCPDGGEWQGWWQRRGGRVRTVAARPLCDPPLEVVLPA